MKNIKIKIITGFRKDQSYTIDAEEAHKAYYLFLNPEKRGVFSNGVALIGSDIRGIEPDYNATMGWNQAHTLDADDYTEINSTGVSRKMNEVLAFAKEIAQIAEPSKMLLPLSKIRNEHPSNPHLLGGMKELIGKMRM